jgi:hypothetical protein
MIYRTYTKKAEKETPEKKTKKKTKLLYKLCVNYLNVSIGKDVGKEDKLEMNTFLLGKP